MVAENELAILKWNRFSALAILISSVVVLIFKDTTVLSMVSSLSFSYYIINNISTLKELTPFGGYANRITFLRLLILFSMLFFWREVSKFTLVGILSLFVILDGLDGFLARKYNQATVFGKYFDMELDALFVLFSCVVIYFKNISGIWILIPGLLRYIFVIYTWMIGPIETAEKKTSYGTIIAVSFFINLLISLVFQNSVQKIFLLFSALLVVVSFLISFYQYRRK